MKPRTVAALLAAVVVCLGAGVTVAYAGGSTQTGQMHCNSGDPLCGFNPVVTGPAPPFVQVGGNCPAFLTTDTWALNFTDGNGHFHFTQNTNGDWGGGTANGSADLTSSVGALEYTGQATVWFGGGQNSNPGGPPTQQSVNGFTFHFNGSGPAGTISIQAHSHQTTNNAGTPTSNVNAGTVTCS
jgi:hypothetical protein